MLSDFKELSVIELEKPTTSGVHKWNMESITKITVDSRIKEDEEIKKIVDYYLGSL